MIYPILWEGDLEGKVTILDQTILPVEKKFCEIKNEKDMWEAIKILKVRGAPALGIAGAYGLILGIRNFKTESFEEFSNKFNEVKNYLETSRPTAVNLFWALKELEKIKEQYKTLSIKSLKEKLLARAKEIFQEDIDMCKKIGQNGKKLIKEEYNILTHCNAGGLATSGYGTALSVIFAAHEEHKKIHVFVDETRPLLQGSRLTAWELKEKNIPYTLICDNTAAFLMKQNKVDIVIVGADRIASNGDTANKIGTYNLAILCHFHKIPFYIAAPFSTFDLNLKTGDEIPLEEREANETIYIKGQQIAPEGTKVYSPAFDVTPAKYISGIITEKGIIIKPFSENI